MENDLLKTTKRLWDSSTYVADYKDIIRLFNSREFFLDVIEYINLPKDASVLEIGIGGGKWSAAFAIMGYRVTAMDNNPEMLVQAQRNFPNIKVEYVNDDLLFLSSEASERKYDLVFNEGVLEHFLAYNERVSAIKAMKGRCIGGGYVYFLVPFLSNQPDEYRYTSIDQMSRELDEAGFKEHTISHITLYASGKKRLMLRVLARNV